MATQEDFVSFMKIWTPEYLGRYEGMWVAFQGDLIDADESLDKLSKRFAKQIQTGEGPLFAFVTFDPVA